MLEKLEDFNRENYTWRLVIIQNLYEFSSQNVSIHPDQYMPHKAKCFNTHKSYTTYHLFIDWYLIESFQSVLLLTFSATARFFEVEHINWLSFSVVFSNNSIEV